MKKESFDLLKKELQHLGILLLVLLAIFKIVFFSEGLLVAAKMAFGLFWLFVLPGYFAMFYWHNRLDFIERLVIGTALAAAVIGTLSYYLGLAGLHIKYHGLFLPIVVIAASLFAIIKKKDA